MHNTIIHNARGLRAAAFGRMCTPSSVPHRELKKSDSYSQCSFWSIHPFKKEECERTGQLKLLLKYNLSSGMRVSGSNSSPVYCILPCSEGARLYAVLSSAPWRGSSCCWVTWGAKPGQHATPALICMVFLEMSLQGRAESSQRCDTCLAEVQHQRFSEVGADTERLELAPEYRLTLASPMTVHWSKGQCHPLDKYKFWKSLSSLSDAFHFFFEEGGEIYTQTIMYMQKRRKICRPNKKSVMWF